FLLGDNSYIVHLNRSIRTVLGAGPATDTPVLDDDLAVVAAMDRRDRTRNHAHRVEAGTARCRYQVAPESRAVEEEPASAIVMRVDARLDALVAASAAVKVDQHQFLALDQSQLGKLFRELDLVGLFPDRLGQDADRRPTSSSDLFLDAFADRGRGLEQFPEC